MEEGKKQEEKEGERRRWEERGMDSKATNSLPCFAQSINQSADMMPAGQRIHLRGP